MPATPVARIIALFLLIHVTLPSRAAPVMVDLDDPKSIEEIHRQSAPPTRRTAPQPKPAPGPAMPSPGPAPRDSDAVLPVRNALSLELGGRGGLYTLNYDWLLDDTWAVGAGLEYFSGANLFFVEARRIALVPVYVNFYPERGTHSFYLTASGNWIHGEARGGSFVDLFGANHAGEPFLSQNAFYGTGGLGYEYRPESAPGFLLRAALYWLVPYNVPWLGLSLGASF